MLKITKTYPGDEHWYPKYTESHSNLIERLGAFNFVLGDEELSALPQMGIKTTDVTGTKWIFECKLLFCPK